MFFKPLVLNTRTWANAGSETTEDDQDLHSLL